MSDATISELPDGGAIRSDDAVPVERDGQTVRVTISTSGASNAADLAFVPSGNVTASNVQDAIEELDAEKASSATLAALKLDDLAAPDDNGDLNASTSRHGLLPKLSGNSSQFLNGLGAFASPNQLVDQLLGRTGGVAVQPAATPPAIGPELWALANFASGSGLNASTLTPSLTANGTAQTSKTVVSLGNGANQDLAWRVRMNIASVPSNGWASISLVLTNAGGSAIAGTAQQRILTLAGGYPWSGKWSFDFKCPTQVSGSVYLMVYLEVFNNSNSGSLAIDSVSVREIAVPQRPILYGTWSAGGGNSYPEIYTPLFDSVSNTWRMVRTDLAADGALTYAYNGIVAYSVDSPFRHDQPDPDFVRSTVAVTNSVGNSENLLATGEITRGLRIGNNDQIIEVLKQDGTTWELRGNVHNGETLRSTSSPNLVFDADPYGDGTWQAWDGLGKYLRTCRKFRFTYNTQIARSSPDNDAIINVDHVLTMFADGMHRMDRTTTFLKDVRVRSMFDWMSSHDTQSPKIGRIGSGLVVLDEVDTFPKVAAPAAPTVTTSGSGGTLSAATYAYAVSALATGGESTPSPVTTVASAGSTSSNSVSWSAVTGAKGYRIYGRTNGAKTQTLLATVGPGVTSWDDDGSTAETGVQPQPVNRARQLEATTTSLDSAISDHATWAVWYDPIVNVCIANIYDRDSVIERAGVAGVKTRLERGGGIMKSYLNIYWEGDGSPSLPASETRLVPLGEEWTATHWTYTYVPADPDNFHFEAAIRSLNLSSLRELYPDS